MARLRRSGRLDPVRLRLPRWRTSARTAAVAALLFLAAITLYTGTGKGCTATPGRSAPDVAPRATVAASPTASRSPAVPDGLVGVTVQVAGPAVAAVVRPGSRVDLYPADGRAAITGVLVIAPVPGDDISGHSAGIFVAMTEDQARQVANDLAGEVFRVIVRSL